MILIDRHIRERQTRTPILTPFRDRYQHASGVSGGLTHCGYDIAVAQDVILSPLDFACFDAVERFDMPDDICAHVRDKSTWARCGLHVLNTVIEPGWRGVLRLELKNLSPRDSIRIDAGTPIAQVQFTQLTGSSAYFGKYQDQGEGQDAIFNGATT